MTREQRLVLTIAVLATIVAFLDSTIVNVALPAIERELGGGLPAQQWIVDAYLLTLGSLILVAGAVSDAFGRVLVVRVGLIVFGLSSLAIALAPDPLVLIIARGVQGVGGALLVPSSLALITSHFSGAAQARAIGTWTALTSAAMLAGPLVGGLFVDLLSWRWAFVINVVPIAVVLWLLVRLGATEVRKPDAKIDLPGALLCAVGLAGPVYALIEQPRLGWDASVIAAAIVGVISFAGFLVRQRVAKHPMMPLGLFRVRNFAWGNVSTFFVYGALGVNGFVIGVYLQEEAGLPATLAGLASLPISILLTLGSSWAGRIAGRVGPRLPMTLGPLVMATGSLLMLFVNEPFNYVTQLLPGILVFGVGLALTVSPLTAAILGSIDPGRSGIASAVNNAVARIAGLLFVAMLGVITGGALDLGGLHRSMWAVAILMTAGGVVAWLCIRRAAVVVVPDAGEVVVTAGASEGGGDHEQHDVDEGPGDHEPEEHTPHPSADREHEPRDSDSQPGEQR
ncbi:MFS transporter [Homoserinibacter sp. GY 40078]|uniref:MFS transporter n=1 Tax=Homoserinibacter sp. GY 40078 TaxID=2603275 RepID=UPI0011C706EA|nr:MFS transporter [Homoserinibacter sp. GY 40078]TXK19778.1 MFS transporter [Homoserinibacter sp. GY 40078]